MDKQIVSIQIMEYYLALKKLAIKPRKHMEEP